MLHKLLLPIRRVADRRPPDELIGSGGSTYMERWHIRRKVGGCNIYLHHFLRSDEDRALHDHPWMNASILLEGCYIEHLAGGIRKLRKPGAIYFRRAETAHRVELLRKYTGDFLQPFKRSLVREKPVWTVFVTGPKVRSWGFLCGPKGWTHWKEFVDSGCGE